MPRKKTRVGCAKTVWRVWSLVQPHLKVHAEEAWATLEARCCCVALCNRRYGIHPTAFFSEGLLRTLPPQAPGVAVSRHKAPGFRSGCQPPLLPLCAPGSTWAATAAENPVHQLLYLHTPIRGIMASTHWGKRQQASALKTVLTPKILKPHRDGPTYK